MVDFSSPENMRRTIARTRAMSMKAPALSKWPFPLLLLAASAPRTRAMEGAFVPYEPSWDGIVAVRVDGQVRCGAALITPRLALSVASCFVKLPLNLTQQYACMRGDCEGTIVDPKTVRLIGGPDARIGVVVARVTRIAVRFTAPWAVPACTKALCGEGWDIAMLELDPTCDHGPMACLPPLRVATVRAVVGLSPTAVGFGSNPSFHRRNEFELYLPTNGSGVRRSAPARIRQVATRQRLTAEVVGSTNARGPFCRGDVGAAL